MIPGGGYREPTYCADIFFDRDQTRDWQRLVCCKELLHLLDAEGNRVRTKEEIDHQIQRMVLPNEFQEMELDGSRVITDKIAIYFAVAVLFPFASREMLLPYYNDGRLTSEDIARMADIPERYALLVMSDTWPAIHSILLGKKK